MRHAAGTCPEAEAQSYDNNQDYIQLGALGTVP